MNESIPDPKWDYGVLTANEELANSTIKDITSFYPFAVVKVFVDSQGKRIVFEDGRRILWLKSYKSLRGHKFDKLWVDRTLPKQDTDLDLLWDCIVGVMEHDIILL